MQSNNNIIGKRINAVLALRGKKQKDLANYLQVKPNVVSYFCTGDRVPNVEQLRKIAEYLSVSSDYLIGLSENPTIEPDIQNACKVTGLSEKAIYNLNELSNEKNSVFKIVNFLLEHEEDENTGFLPNPKGGTFKATLFDYLTSLLLINLDNQDLLSSIPANAIGILENGIITDAYKIYSNGNKKILNIDLNSIIEEAIFQKIKNKLIDIKQLIEKEASEHGEHNTPKE